MRLGWSLSGVGRDWIMAIFWLVGSGRPDGLQPGLVAALVLAIGWLIPSDDLGCRLPLSWSLVVGRWSSVGSAHWDLDTVEDQDAFGGVLLLDDGRIRSPTMTVIAGVRDLDAIFIGCVCRKLNPDVMVMKAAEDGV